MVAFSFGPQACTTLAESAGREWLVADGCGGYATGTVAGLRTRRYHGLQVVSAGPPGRRHLGLAALDPVLAIGGARIRLGAHEWVGGVVDPVGHELLCSFCLLDGVPRWRWALGGVTLEREVAMARGRPAVGVVHRLVASPGPVRVELGVLCTWRDAHGTRAGDGWPAQENLSDGFAFEAAYRVRGPGWSPGGTWYRGAFYREEAARGLPDSEDLWWAGTFSAELAPGEELSVEAWADPTTTPPAPAPRLVDQARARARLMVEACRALDEVDEALALAADQFIVEGPVVVAGYPWFGEWSRDALTSYEGLFLETGRADEGRQLLSRQIELISDGLLPNTTDAGEAEYNSADAILWLLHAVGRHVVRSGDGDLAATGLPGLERAVGTLMEGTRFGIGADPADGLLTQGEHGVALTWMDARVDGRPVTARAGKAVEIEALWISGLETLAAMQRLVGRPDDVASSLARRARTSFLGRFPLGEGLADVLDADPAVAARVRPNQLLAVSLPYGPMRDRPDAGGVVAVARDQLLIPLGLRSLSPSDPGYRPRHRGGPAARDLAYHQGTVWPWLVGAYVDACLATGTPTSGVLDALEAHLADYGVGSVSETADGAPPHHATGCPFQAWSVAEVLRARRALRRAGQ